MDLLKLHLADLHYTILRDAQGRQAGHMGLDLEHLGAREPAQSFEAIGDAALVQGAQAGHFRVVHRRAGRSPSGAMAQARTPLAFPLRNILLVYTMGRNHAAHRKAVS